MNKTIMIAVIVGLIVLGGAYWFVSMKGTSQTGMMNQDAAMDNEVTAQDSMNQDGVMVGGALMTPDKDIVDNAVMSKDHTTLVAAVQAAGLVDTLKGDGPFTVFAPTNAAFDKLPAGTVDTLLLPGNKAKLTDILTYHVVPGTYRAEDITDGLTLETVNGQMLTFTQKDGKWWINDSAMIDIADVISSNGVTHVIDTVLLPK